MNLLRGGKPVPIDPDVRAGEEESVCLSAWNMDTKSKIDRSGGFVLWFCCFILFWFCFFFMDVGEKAGTWFKC